MAHRTTRLVAVALAVVAGGVVAVDARGDDMPVGGVITERTPLCGPADLPETGIQGDVPLADQESGRAEDGYNCGLALVGHTNLGADNRQPDSNGNMAWAGDCAYIAGPGAVFGNPSPTDAHGVAVVDVSDPTRPRHVRTLRTPGSLAAMETLHAVETPERAVLVVGQYGNQAGGNKPMDVYDVSDCASPRLMETFVWPKNIHNLTISGNGRYVFATQPLQAADIEPLFDGDPATGTVYLGDLEEVTPAPPFALGPTADADDALPEDARNATRGFYLSHEAWPTDDGTKLYVGGQLPVFETFSIIDIAAWLTRDADNRPSGPPRVISQRSGRGHSVRTATIRGGDEPRRFVLHSEESVFGPTWGCLPESTNPFAGPAQPWLTEITDEENPALVAQFGLEINDPANCAAQLSSGVSASVHYHDVDDAEDTTFVLASMWNAGLRVFDVRDPAVPREVAYFNPADIDRGDGVLLDHAWSHIRYRPALGHVWLATADGGFWVLEMEPQVRAHLDLDDGALGPPPVHHPGGRPGTRPANTTPPRPAVVDPSAYYCTLGVASALGPPGADPLSSVA